MTSFSLSEVLNCGHLLSLIELLLSERAWRHVVLIRGKVADLHTFSVSSHGAEQCLRRPYPGQLF